MPELIFEIGTEEIPAGYIQPALEFLEKRLKEYFVKNHIACGEARTFATPRRLAIAFSDVAARQEDVVETFLGPNVKAAFDSEGNPTKAALGFARGKGVDVADLTREQTPKGEVICTRVDKKGRPTEPLLNEVLPQIIGEIPFPKKMRWGASAQAFTRPVHWIAAVFGAKTLDFEWNGVACSNQSRGHRFLKPDTFTFNNLSAYLNGCEAHFVVADPVERRNRIWEKVKTLAEDAGGRVPEDRDLLAETANLVEYPVPLLCDFEDKYLELPKELLVTTMRVHQRYFPVEDGQGGLKPRFITVSNVPADGESRIKRGNERVLRARLEDARFFYEEDRKRPLEDYVEKLRGVVFQKYLGTSYEKVERFCALAKKIAERAAPESAENVARAARLCKADLETQMVYEFPELQGIMGGYYAERSGENPEIALAIKEHYRPAFAGDDVPSNAAGACVALADKLDTILGVIGVGLIPSGSEDPYALRRHALGVIEIILERGWSLSLDELIDCELDQLEGKLRLTREETREHALDLFRQRFKSRFTALGFAYDVIDAVLATGIDSFTDAAKKVEALSELKKQEWFEPLATAFRRVVSILNEEAEGEVDPNGFQDPAEQALYEHYLKISAPVARHIGEKEFPQALAKIVEIKPSVDAFFDKVMVMVEDEALRKNRLHLLFHISRLFAQLADFSRIVIKKS